MPTTGTLVLLWLAFAASHMGLSSVPVRSRLVGRIGEQAFLGLYSVLALALFVPLVWVYFSNKHDGAWLWEIPRSPALDWALYLAMGVAFVLVVASFTPSNPSRLGGGPGVAQGVFRITRHPLFMGIALWALLHLVPNGSSADVAFFGGMVVFSLVGAMHQDRRKLATGTPGYREFYQATPLLPFSGADTLRGLRELPPLALVIGVALTVALRVFHEDLFGAAP